MAENGALGGVGVVVDSLLPPHAVAVSAIARTSASRAGTVNQVRILVSGTQYRLEPVAASTITAGVSPTMANIGIPHWHNGTQRSN